MTEFMGYAGAMLVVLSMLMRSVTRLRAVNTAGCAISAIYALIVQAFPTVLMNVVLVLINSYYLVQMRKNVNSPERKEDLET